MAGSASVGCLHSGGLNLGGLHPRGGQTPLVNRMTDRCKNITLPQIRLRAVIICFLIYIVKRDTNGKNEHTSGFRDERVFDSLSLIHRSLKMVMDIQNHTNYFYHLHTPTPPPWTFKTTLP